MLVGNDKEYIKIILVPNATMMVLMQKKKKERKIYVCPEAYLKFKIPSRSGAGEQMGSGGPP